MTAASRSICPVAVIDGATGRRWSGRTQILCGPLPSMTRPHSITSSARARIEGGTVRPSGLGSLQVDDELEFVRLFDRAGRPPPVPAERGVRRPREEPKVCRLVWEFFCQVVFCCSGSLFGAERPFLVPSPAIRFAERAEGVKGPKC